MSDTMLPPHAARSPLVMSYDLEEAANNIGELAAELNPDGSNRGYVIRRIKAEIEWLYELIDELEGAAL